MIRWSSRVLANNVLISGCAENRRRERDLVVHAHQVHRIQQTVRGKIAVLCRRRAATNVLVEDRTAK